jgi:tRNA (adenine57-N1/adenine58-N1)-methyltransferase
MSSSPAVCLQQHQHIAEGDLVIVYENHQYQHAVRVMPPKKFSCRFGTFDHRAMVGMRFGDKMTCSSGGSGRGGFVYLLPPTPELWTATLPHRTQILYIADISMITLQLEIGPGSVVVEAGTGSGSLSHALARAVGPSGHLHTFEFNGHRAKLAAEEFSANGLDGRVTCMHGDVCASEWSYEALGPNSVDAIVFDLPNPEIAVPKAAHLLKPGGRLCSFSPCIEQIARTMEVLGACGLTRAEVLETLLWTHEVRAPPSKPDNLALAVAAAERAATAPPDVSAASESGAPTASSDALTGAVTESEAPPGKRQRVDAPAGDGAASEPPKGATKATAAVSAAPSGGAITKPCNDMRGHTGYLLFCTKHVG